MGNKNFPLGTKWWFAAPFSPSYLKNGKIYKKMLHDIFCCIFYKESFASNRIKIGQEIKIFEKLNFSMNLV